MLLVSGAHASGPTEQDKRQADCYDDVMRLCGDAVPDHDRVKACMLAKRRQVSPRCAVWFDRPE